MNHVRPPLVCSLALLAPVLLLPGCIAVAGAAAGGAGVAYAMGEFEATVEGSPKETVQAARRALDDLDIHLVASDSTSVDGRVEGRTALDKKVVIAVTRVDDERSKVEIRVGTWGDEALSRRVYERIVERL